MIEVLLSWIVIFVSAYLWGNLGIAGFCRIMGTDSNPSVEAPDLMFFIGACLLNVYAQAFSIFYKVGNLALLVVLLVDVLSIVLLHVPIVQRFRRFLKQISWQRALVGAVVGLYLLGMTAQTAAHYDTYLYHAQSIRWIEEYGVVKGLGNLHNRLAYGSAFFCFQALFSFSEFLGRSLHTANGLFALAFIYYSIFSAKYWSDHRFHASDGIRLAMIGVFCLEYTYSSPGSDLLAMGLVVYLFCKWVSLREEGEHWLGSYILLCFLAVWAASVKLSAAMLVLFSIYPVAKLIKTKQTRVLICSVFIACLIALPFFVRNILVSGYLVYPYPEIDLFSVDWKMSAQTAIADRLEINAWGYGLRDSARYNEPMKVRIATWYHRSWLHQLLSWTVVVALIGEGIRNLYQLFVKKNREEIHSLFVLTVMTAGLLLWFFGSPNIRYGRGYLLSIPLFVLFTWLDGYRVRFGRISITVFSCTMALVGYMLITYKPFHWLKASDYEYLPYVEHTVQGIVFYTPEKGDQLGYDPFPSTPYASKLEHIELRDGTLAGGFRLK